MGQQRPASTENEVVLDVATEAGQLRSQATVGTPPVRLGLLRREPFGPRREAEADDQEAAARPARAPNTSAGPIVPPAPG
jgi:hypothetical protein